MKNAQHTPGPWELSIGTDESGNAEFCIHNEVTICRGDDEAVAWRANARLIAAAPDLLEALEGLFSLHEPEGRFQPSHYKPFLFAVTAALAKAKGEQAKATA